MKKLTIPIIILAIVALSGFIAFRAISLAQTPNQNKFGTGQVDLKSQTQVLAANNLRHATLAIDGMWCSSCAVGAEYALKEKNGVMNAVVGFSENLEGIGEVIYNPQQIDLEEITKAVEPYEASVTKDEQTISANLKNLTR